MFGKETATRIIQSVFTLPSLETEDYLEPEYVGLTDIHGFILTEGDTVYLEGTHSVGIIQTISDESPYFISDDLTPQYAGYAAYVVWNGGISADWHNGSALVLAGMNS